MTAADEDLGPRTPGVSEPVELETLFRDAAIMISRFHSARTGSEYFQFSTSPCSVMRIWPKKSPGGCDRIT